MKLTNRDIDANHRYDVFWLLPNDFVGAFAYWVYTQGRNMEMDFSKAIKAFRNHIDSSFKKKEIPEEFNLGAIETLVDSKLLFSIPEIAELNENNDKDFIDLGALERNVKYMIVREQIIQLL